MKKIGNIYFAILVAQLSVMTVAKTSGDPTPNYSEEALTNIAALRQDQVIDCSYIRTESHCVFKRVTYRDTVIKGKISRASSVEEVPYMNMAVACKPGGNMSCKNITCEDVWQIIKSVDPNVIYMKQPKSQKYFDKFFKK